MKKIIRENLALIISLAILLVLLAIPTGYEDAEIFTDRERAVAEVTAVNNEHIITVGIVHTGDQTCELEILDGKFKGETAEGFNMLTGSVEADKIYSVGDEVLVLISVENDEVSFVSMIDHYRINVELILVGLFFVFLIIVAGKTGLKSILSFAISILMIWKVLVPGYLDGINPIILGFIIVAVLTVIIISLVFEFGKMMMAATIGSLTGTFVTMIMALIFTDFFTLSDIIPQGSQGLLYSGFPNLDLTEIFIASIFIGSSGAVMDLAVDITASVNEVVEKKPDISAKEAIKSGMNVGRAAMGTMTTTLLLAYSGGYITLLMIFMAQGTPVDNILNYRYMSSEILDTVVGSFGLVSVAPLTAICAGIFLTKKTGVK